jgi:hypothetical protein
MISAPVCRQSIKLNVTIRNGDEGNNAVFRRFPVLWPAAQCVTLSTCLCMQRIDFRSRIGRGLTSEVKERRELQPPRPRKGQGLEKRSLRRLVAKDLSSRTSTLNRITAQVSAEKDASRLITLLHSEVPKSWQSDLIRG